MIGRLNHVAIVVPDLAVAASLYRETLGAQVSAPVALPHHGVTTVFVELENTKIELLHPLGEESPIRGFRITVPETLAWLACNAKSPTRALRASAVSPVTTHLPLVPEEPESTALVPGLNRTLPPSRHARERAL